MDIEVPLSGSFLETFEQLIKEADQREKEIGITLENDEFWMRRWQKEGGTPELLKEFQQQRNMQLATLSAAAKQIAVLHARINVLESIFQEHLEQSADTQSLKCSVVEQTSEEACEKG